MTTAVVQNHSFQNNYNNKKEYKKYPQQLRKITISQMYQRMKQNVTALCAQTKHTRKCPPAYSESNGTERNESVQKAAGDWTHSITINGV